MRKFSMPMAAGVLALALVPAAAAAPALGATARGQAAATATPREEVTTHSVSLAAQRATLAYWTRERMESAKPPPIIHKRLPARGRIIAAGKPGRAAGGAPGRPGDVTGDRPDSSSGPATVSRPDYPFPYSSFNVPAADYTQWPYEVNGKIFFVNNGGNYVCSGTSVASYHGAKLEDEVWTAGHCVGNTSLTDPGVWDSNAIFVPAYNGTAKVTDPFGKFVATRLATVNTFFYNADISEDEGAMEVAANASGQALGQAVGWDGFAWNYPSQEAFTAFGYPAAAPYTGNLMIEDIASTAATDNWPGGAGQPLLGIGDPMTGGSSGGAWDIDWSRSSPGYIDGHNDYKFYSQPNAMYSPYQDSLSNRVRCFGASSC